MQMETFSILLFIRSQVCTCCLISTYGTWGAQQYLTSIYDLQYSSLLLCVRIFELEFLPSCKAHNEIRGAHSIICHCLLKFFTVSLVCLPWSNPHDWMRGTPLLQRSWDHTATNDTQFPNMWRFFRRGSLQMWRWPARAKTSSSCAIH